MPSCFLLFLVLLLMADSNIFTDAFESSEANQECPFARRCINGVWKSPYIFEKYFFQLASTRKETVGSLRLTTDSTFYFYSSCSLHTFRILVVLPRQHTRHFPPSPSVSNGVHAPSPRIYRGGCTLDSKWHVFLPP
uniref:Putative secreted protein n=1 Tax=Anopheles triannulatus TaxID=58253 RepID=A0A2M4B0H2_9DIPT